MIISTSNQFKKHQLTFGELIKFLFFMIFYLASLFSEYISYIFIVTKNKVLKRGLNTGGLNMLLHNDSMGTVIADIIIALIFFIQAKWHEKSPWGSNILGNLCYICTILNCLDALLTLINL